MRPEKLLESQVIPTPDHIKYPQEEEITGPELEARYRQCANVYRRIVECVRSGSDTTAPDSTIQLGTADARNAATGRQEEYQLSVVLDLTEYGPDTPGFAISANFQKVSKPGRPFVFLHAVENFGSTIQQSEATAVPEFINNPDTTVAHDWSSGYDEYAGQLYPMIRNAEESQSWIIESLLNRDLNPASFERACQIFGDQTLEEQ